MSRHLVLVPHARSKRGPAKPKRLFRVTLWLTAAQHLRLLRLASEMERGKISLHEYVVRALNIQVEDCERTEDTRRVRHSIKHMSTPPQLVAVGVPNRRKAAA